MNNKDGTVNISLERFKELEGYEKMIEEVKNLDYLYSHTLCGYRTFSTDTFITRKEFKDKLYQKMKSEIDQLKITIAEKDKEIEELIKKKKGFFKL